MTDLNESITHTHPAVTRCFPDGRVEGPNIMMAKMFAEVIRDGLPLLTEDELKQLPKVQQMLHEAFIAGCQQGSEDNENGVEEIDPSAYPAHLVETMIAAGEFAPATRDMDATRVLHEWMQGLGTDQVTVTMVDGTQVTGTIHYYHEVIDAKDRRDVIVKSDRRAICLASDSTHRGAIDDRGWNPQVARVMPVKA